MIDLFICNIRTIVIVLVIIKVGRWFLRIIKFEIKYFFKKKRISSNKSIKYYLKVISIYTVLVCLTTLQQLYPFINLGQEENYISLIIGILTLYGVFYVFIQFAISYASQNDNDKHWGSSKTKFLLTENTEYKLFNSNTFKFIFAFSLMFPFLKEITIFNIGLLSLYENFVISLWNVSILSIYVLYILLFIKSLFIMNRFFSIQEKHSYSHYYLNDRIEREIKEGYTTFLFESKGNHEYFIKSLIKKVDSIDKNEKADMLYGVLNYSIDEIKWLQKIYIQKINKGRKINKRVINKFSDETNSLMYIFVYLWKHLEKRKVELDFDRLLNVYRNQDNVLFNQIYIYSLGDVEKLAQDINMFYNHSMYNSYGRKSSYFKVPKIIWDSINSYDLLIKLNDYIYEKEATKKVIGKYLDNSKVYEFTSDEKKLIYSYNDYLEKLLNKLKTFQEKLQKDDLIYLFGTYSFNKKELELNTIIQKRIYTYIIRQEYSDLDKEYIKFLLKEIDYKYTLAFTFYIMLYTGSSPYSKWKGDILFLRKINNNYYYDEKIDSDKNIEFICKTISERNIGYKISDDLIIWIIKNLRNKLNENIIQRCIDDPYMNYAKFLKFKYIFKKDNSFYISFSDVNVDDFEVSDCSDWRLIFLRDILKTPNLLKTKFFSMHQYKFYKKILQPKLPKEIFNTQDFRMFYINPYFSLNEEQFLQLIEEYNFIRKGLFEFLILKLENEQYNYLILHNKIQEIFTKKVKRIIDSSNKSLKDYIDNLANRANECSEDTISEFMKERIIFILKKSIY